MQILAIERRMDEVALQLQDTGDAFDGARRAERMANQRFRRGQKRETARRQTERAPPVTDFDAVALRGGKVAGNEIDVAGRDTSRFDRRMNAAPHAFGVARGHRAAIALPAAIDGGAARLQHR